MTRAGEQTIAHFTKCNPNAQALRSKQKAPEFINSRTCRGDFYEHGDGNHLHNIYFADIAFAACDFFSEVLSVPLPYDRNPSRTSGAPAPNSPEWLAMQEVERQVQWREWQDRLVYDHGLELSIYFLVLAHALFFSLHLIQRGRPPSFVLLGNSGLASILLVTGCYPYLLPPQEHMFNANAVTGYVLFMALVVAVVWRTKLSARDNYGNP